MIGLVELGEVPPDLHRSAVKVSRSQLPDSEFLLIEQDDAKVCISKRQAEHLVRYLEDFNEGR